MQDDTQTRARRQGGRQGGRRGADDPGVARPVGAAQRPRLTRVDVFRLILAAYKTAFPYFLLFILVMLIVTWLLTEFAFKP